VISLIGLNSDEQRQSFVSQLQMGLMSWIKAHPARERPLSGLLVMDEAQTIAPSGPTTPATESTLALASQARKYGLGLIFATQAPRGIHNRIVGNAATQFYGLIKAPAQIAAVRQLAQSRSGEPIDVSGLGTGTFYLSDEGAAFRKISVPMSLSHHPPSALSAEEALTRHAAEQSLSAALTNCRSTCQPYATDPSQLERPPVTSRTRWAVTAVHAQSRPPAKKKPTARGGRPAPHPPPNLCPSWSRSMSSVFLAPSPT
jgi:hypothetical protein